ncbi:MAG: hypothetical protein FWD78_01760 [Treponema sp.]|nr:hypothetical protein [Treponema sp.]
MSDTSIVYKKFDFDTFKDEIIKELGEKIWDELTLDNIIPNITAESKCKCVNMIKFMERFDNIVDKDTAKKILSRVRHGLKPSQSAWAREKFLKIGNLDEFMKQSLDEEILKFEKLHNENKDFYGDIITGQVLEYLKSSPSTLIGIRAGNKLHFTAFPAQMHKYLNTDDPKMKRYYACHCPFAKESILTEKVVSSTLCNCSLGHIKNFWEAVFDRELDGEVLTSALKGDLKCTYAVYIPDDIMELYVKQ